MRIRLALLAVLAVLAAFLTTGSALAQHKPTVHQLRHQITELNRQLAALDQDYDAQRQETSQAAQIVRAQAAVVTRTEKSVAARRKQAIAIAVSAYENSGQTAPAALLTSGNTSSVLKEAPVLQELSHNDATVLRTYEAGVARLTALRATQARYEAATEALHRAVKTRRHRLAALTKRENALLRQLAPAHQAGLGPGGISVSSSYTGPTSTQAGKAVSFAYAQLGCTYVWGGTGPCSAGFDCSGLVQAAWAYAGVLIPRTSQEQLAGLPSVPVADIQPGDLIIMLGGDHVGMYVGGGYLIDAPHTGAVVERVAFTGWYLANMTAVVRP